MNERYFQIFQNGMADQLKELSLDEMVLYLRNHLHNFLLDGRLCFCFIERFANDPDIGKHEAGKRALFYLLDKALQLRPFRPGLLEAAARITQNERVAQRKAVVDGLMQSRELYDQITGLDVRHEAPDIQEFIGKLVEAHPTHVAAAQYALHIDKFLGCVPGAWLDAFKCPKQLEADWNIHLFNHLASLAEFEEAAKVWPKLDASLFRETALNNAAEMFRSQGETAKAIELYEASLAQDPRQTPVALRLEQLRNPFQPDPSLPKSCDVAVCVYSWNKADILGQTLESLSETDLGNAEIHILLNGCTDDSREVVDGVLPRFPDNRMTVHELHVNIGAPAARNWLMRLPEVRKNTYMAFIDDDITLQRDWLAQFLTVAENDPKVGAVGCKIVDPGFPRRFQYLFRYVAIADHGLLKLSIPAPPEQHDNGLYDSVRETRSVMGCQHLLRTSAVETIPEGFDIRFSPSQVDDMDHDMGLCLAGFKVVHCGTVTCEHHQGSGIALIKAQEWNAGRTGNAMGNDIKFFFKRFDQMGRMKALDNLSLDLGVEQPDF